MLRPYHPGMQDETCKEFRQISQDTQNYLQASQLRLQSTFKSILFVFSATNWLIIWSFKQEKHSIDWWADKSAAD